MIFGQDVSSFQGAYDWPGNLAFGFAKATEGTFYQDRFFAHNWTALADARKLRGAYHFGHPGTSATSQARFFVDFVSGHGLRSDDALALDLEVSDGLPPASVARWAVAFVTEIKHLTGKNPFVYTDLSFIGGGYCEGLFNQPLWLGDPNGAPGGVPDVSPWPVWSLHQYSWSPVDQDALNGNATTWARLVNVPDHR